MEIWLLLIALAAALMFGIDFLLRRKRWKKNTREEKQSLLVSLACLPAYVFLSVLGMLLGIAAPTAETVYGGLLFDMAVMTGRFIWVVSIAAFVLGLVLRKRGNPRGSKLAQLAAMGYIALFGILCVASGLL